MIPSRTSESSPVKPVLILIPVLKTRASHPVHFSCVKSVITKLICIPGRSPPYCSLATAPNFTPRLCQQTVSIVASLLSFLIFFDFIDMVYFLGSHFCVGYFVIGFHHIRRNPLPFMKSFKSLSTYVLILC